MIHGDLLWLVWNEPIPWSGEVAGIRHRRSIEERCVGHQIRGCSRLKTRSTTLRQRLAGRESAAASGSVLDAEDVGRPPSAGLDSANPPWTRRTAGGGRRCRVPGSGDVTVVSGDPVAARERPGGGDRRRRPANVRASRGSFFLRRTTSCQKGVAQGSPCALGTDCRRCFGSRRIHVLVSLAGGDRSGPVRIPRGDVRLDRDAWLGAESDGHGILAFNETWAN